MMMEADEPDEEGFRLAEMLLAPPDYEEIRARVREEIKIRASDGELGGSAQLEPSMTAEEICAELRITPPKELRAKLEKLGLKNEKSRGQTRGLPH